MEILTKVIYFLAIFVSVSNVEYSKSAIVLQIQTVPNGVSSAKLIECAFQLMKTSDKSFVKIAAGTEVCEQLPRPASIESSFFEEGFEYLEISATFKEYYDTSSSYKEKITHHIYSEVKTGDEFDFLFQKMNQDKLYITFKNTTLTSVLIFNDDSTQLYLNSKYDNEGDGDEKPAYPFQDSKIYKITFEVLEPHWRISINDEVLTTFDHRYAPKLITKIVIKFGPSIKYLSKAVNPRN